MRLFTARDPTTGTEVDWLAQHETLCKLLAETRRSSSLQEAILSELRLLRQDIQDANTRGAELLDAAERMERLTRRLEDAEVHVCGALESHAQRVEGRGSDAP